MAAASPTLLTPEEAAAIARCSVKTVRRAYASGALTIADVDREPCF